MYLDSQGNYYFPSGIYVGSIPAVTGNQTQVLVPGPGGRISLASISQISTGGSTVTGVTSFNGRTGDVLPVPGDYISDTVKEGFRNFYFTNERARAAISLTTFGTNGAATYNPITGIFNIPQYSSAVETDPIFTASVAANITTTNINNWNGAYSWGNHTLAGYLTSFTETDPIWNSEKVLYYTKVESDTTFVTLNTTQTITGQKTFSSAITGIGLLLQSGFNPTPSTGYVGVGSTSSDGINILTKSGATVYNHNLQFTANSNDYYFPNATGTIALTSDLTGYVTSVTATSPLSSSGGTTPNITIAQSSGSTSGYLSSADWITFNNKQSALTNPVTGIGTATYLSKFTGTTSIGSTKITEDVSNVVAFEGNSGSGGSLNIKLYSTTSVKGDGYANMTATNSNYWIFGIRNTTNKEFIFDVGLLTTNTTRYYTMPDASGTIALTSNLTGYATETYVTTQISNLVNSAPAALNTLNELAVALGNDANFSTTITNLIGTKEPAIIAGTALQYWRGDKTWQTLPSYTLPIASATALGGIKVGANLSIDVNGILSSTDTNTTYANFTRTVSGLVPNPGGATTNRYLREDGTWVIPPDNDTIYVHPTTAGNKHIPAGGAAGQILRWSADGTATWGTDTDTDTWNANSINVAGYVAAPGAVANKVWKTDGSGNPAWRDDADTIVTSLPWSSITGKPTALSGFTNDLGNYGDWVVRTGDSMSGRLTINTGNSTNLPLYLLSTQPYIQIEALGASNTAEIRMYPTTGYQAWLGNYGSGELVLVAGNTGSVYITSNSLRVAKYRFNGNSTLSGNGTPEIVDMASVGMAMQALNYRWYNSAASSLLMSLDTVGNLSANAFYETSDIRYKNIIETNPSLTLDGLDVIKFTRPGSSVIRYGYSAQQVKSLSEDLIGGTVDELTVNYSDVHTLKIAALEKRIAELEAKLTNNGL